MLDDEDRVMRVHSSVALFSFGQYRHLGRKGRIWANENYMCGQWPAVIRQNAVSCVKPRYLLDTSGLLD